jgi:hypothetical protein
MFRQFSQFVILGSITLGMLAGCNGSETGYSRSVNRFVRSLNYSDSGLFTSYDSEVILYTNETERSLISGEGDWFVIYDDRRDRYMAVRIGYLRGLEGYGYEDYIGELGDSFRSNEGFNRLFGNTNGDSGGDNYEAVDLGLDGLFYGRESGYTYEDEDFVTDVNLLVANSEELNFYKKVAFISYTHSVAPRTASRLLTLGKKLEALNLGETSEISLEDSNVLLKDLESLAGVSKAELLELMSNSRKKQDILNKVSTHIGTTSQNLEDHILPELFGINL